MQDTGVIDESKIEYLRQEKARLIAENESMLKTNVQLASLQQLMWEEEQSPAGGISSENVMSKLIKQLENTKRENEELNKRLSNESEVGLRPGIEVRTAATSPLVENIHVVANPIELQSLKQANSRLKQELDQLKMEREKFKRDLVRIQQAKVVYSFLIITFSLVFIPLMFILAFKMGYCFVLNIKLYKTNYLRHYVRATLLNYEEDTTECSRP